MCDNQVYDLITEIEAIKVLQKNNSMLVKKVLQAFQTIRNNKTMKKLQNFFKNKINF